MSYRCPTCKAKAFCKNTRNRSNGSVNRTYRCVDGHRFSSIEVIVRVGRGKAHLPNAGSLKGRLSATLLAEVKEELKQRLLKAFEEPIGT